MAAPTCPANLPGANLPGANALRQAELLPRLFDVTWPLVGVCAFHSFALVSLLGLALMDFDRQAIPCRFAVGVIVAGFAAPAIWPNLWPVAWSAPRPAWIADVAGLDRVDTGVLGLIFGASLGAALALAEGPRRNRRGGRQLAILGFAFVGLCLGWQAALSIAAISVGLGLGVYRVFLPAWLHLMVWSGLNNLPWWPGSTATLPALAASLAAVFSVALVWRMWRARMGASNGSGASLASEPPSRDEVASKDTSHVGPPNDTATPA